MDYRDFAGGGKAAGTSQQDVGFWWAESDKHTSAERLVKAGGALKERSQPRTQANLRHARLYGNFDLTAFALRDYSASASVPTNKISLNVVASCIDTLSAKVCKNKPRPSFQTDGASWSMRQKARLIDKFTRGLYYETKIYEQMVEVFFDALIFDLGALKAYIDPQTKRVKFERTFPEELYVDETDGVYGTPRQMLQRKYLPREVLLAEFGDKPEIAEIIKGAKPPADAYQRGHGDVVEVWEGWHLPSGEGVGDGKHIIAIKGACLQAQEWKFEFFPFVFLRFSKRRLGFFGQGLAERLSGIQLEINRLLRSITEQLRRKGKGRIFVQKGSGVAPSHLTNDVADIIFYTGAAPVVDNANSVAPEEFMQLERLRSWAYQEAGISELSAGAKKPSGLDSQPALREFNDIETERFALVAKAYEQAFLDAADIALELIRSTGGSGYKVKLPNKRFIEEIDWSDIDLSRDAYVMQMFPVSSLPQTPAARQQRVRELMADGFIEDKAEARRLLDFPDLEANGNLATAAIDDVDATIGAILDAPTPQYRPPEEYQNLAMLVQRATASYLYARHHGCDAKRLAMLRRLIDETSAKITAAMSPPKAVAGAPAPAASMAPPAPMSPVTNMNINPSVDVSVPVPPAVPPLM